MRIFIEHLKRIGLGIMAFLIIAFLAYIIVSYPIITGIFLIVVLTGIIIYMLGALVEEALSN